MCAYASMSQRDDNRGTTIRQRSGWLIPVAVFLVTAALSALFLLYYLAPTPNSFIEEHPSPTARSDAIALSVDEFKLVIPANYIVYSSARQGGPRKEVALAATLPDFHGYSDWYASTFADNGPDSPVVYLLIRDAIHLPRRFRLSRRRSLRRTDAEGPGRVALRPLQPECAEPLLLARRAPGASRSAQLSLQAHPSDALARDRRRRGRPHGLFHPDQEIVSPRGSAPR